MVKRIISVLLSLCFLVSFCSCAEGDTLREDEILSWNDFFTRYSQTYNPAFEDFINNNDVNMNIRLAFSSGEITFAMCYGFFNDDAKDILSKVFSYVGCSDFEYEENGDTAVLYAKRDDLNIKYEMKYKNNSALLTYYVEDVLAEQMSVCLHEGYTAKTYTNTENEYRYIIYANGDIYIGKDKAKDALKVSLYDNPEKAKYTSFITNMAGVCSFVKGKIEVSGTFA
ncbi:MAG: hypothetical protein K6F76_06325 [Clostridiales bacterium]|nr:hypothetical protein [Clostridiales bacterium]